MGGMVLFDFDDGVFRTGTARAFFFPGGGCVSILRLAAVVSVFAGAMPLFALASMLEGATRPVAAIGTLCWSIFGIP